MRIILGMLMAWGGWGFRVMSAPFTYQGRLTDGTAPANGSYDLRFRVFGALSGGTQVGPDVAVSPVSVTNGLFTVSLEFGNGVFTGADRWLEIAARTAGDTNAHVVLAPRQPITAVPYAMFSFAGTGDAGALTSGMLPDARLSTNIARSADVLAVRNDLGARVVATNDAVQAQLAALTARLNQLSNTVNGLLTLGTSGLASSSVFASRNGSDGAMATLGLSRFARLEGGGWRNGATDGAPVARSEHVMAWTGSRLLVWGGRTTRGSPLNTGALYDPMADAWTTLPSVDAPAGRWGAAWAWTGDRLVLWGGFGSTVLGTGAFYAPATNQWRAINTTNAPAARSDHAAAWTGSRFVVWGGRNPTGLLNNGALINIDSGAWTALPQTNAPQARQGATMLWAGDRLLIFGGEGSSGELAAGAALPMTGGITPGAWRSLSPTNAPGARSGHTAIWTGSRMIVWGGVRNGVRLGDGASYNPATDTWSPIATNAAPSARSGHAAVWTGQEMIVHGGDSGAGPLATTAAYDPATDTWRSLDGPVSPLARVGAGAAWAGDELLVFGGLNSNSSAVASLQRLNPQSVWFLYRKP
ncbi:MAG: hypothetical protein WCR07_05175 [Verrucomicrobiota bacterium]